MTVQWFRARDPGVALAQSRTLRTAGVIPAALLLCGYLAYNRAALTAKAWDQLQRGVADRAQPLAEWVARNAPPDAVLATDDDALIYLYTGRRAFPTGRFTPQEYLTPQTPAFAVEGLREILHTYPADYVLASSEYGAYAVRGLLTSKPPELRIVSVLSSGAVFAPVKGTAP